LKLEPDATEPGSAELLGQSDDDALGTTQDGESVDVLVLRDLAHELGAVAAQAADDKLSRLEDQMLRMRDDFDARFDSMMEVFESRRADGEVEAVAAERTQDGAEALREIGIRVR
jgi:hypothetical protein